MNITKIASKLLDKGELSLAKQVLALESPRSQYDLIELHPNQMKTDEDIYQVIKLLKDQGVDAWIGSRQKSDVLVNRGYGKRALEILESAQYRLAREVLALENNYETEEDNDDPSGDWQDDTYLARRKSLYKALDELKMKMLVRPIDPKTQQPSDSPNAHEQWLRSVGKEVVRLRDVHSELWRSLTGQNFRG